jgi:hypothetical protein
VGQSVTFTGTVTKSSGAAMPSGLVLLKDSTTGTFIANATLSSTGCTTQPAPCFTIATSLLPGSSSGYNLVAHYGGDATFGPSDSNLLSMTVPKVNSQVVVSLVTFGANGTPSLSTGPISTSYGSSYILRVDVENAGLTPPGPCQNFSTGVISFVCPTGSINLFRNGGGLNDFPQAQIPNFTGLAALNDRGFAEDQPIQLNVGSYSITASYTADANSSYNSNPNSNTLSVTITKAMTTTTVAASPTSIAAGGRVTLTATIATSSNGVAPCGNFATGDTGVVQFMNGGSAISGIVTYTGTSGAQSTTGQGSCTATLTTTLSQFIPPAQPRTRPQVPVLPLGVVSVLLTVFLAMQRRLSIGKRVGYTAAGLVLLTSMAAGIAGCSGSKSSSSNGGGSHTDSITAVYSGDANYAGSTSSATPVTIQ